MSSAARWAIRSLTAVLLSTALAWGGVALAPPAGADASLALTPEQGPPGTSVHVHGYGFEDCLTRRQSATGGGQRYPAQIDVTFADGSPVAAVADPDSGEFETDLGVPSDAAPGAYEVKAVCTAKGSGIRATAQFTVTPPAEPALLLEPGSAPGNTTVRATGSGFDACTGGTATLSWDGIPALEVDPDPAGIEQGGFTAEFDVPADTAAGGYTVTAQCGDDDTIRAEAPFTVEPGRGPSPPSTPDVALDPAEGPAGTSPVRMSGSGFDCREVDVLWDGGSMETVGVDDDGTFTAEFAVPADGAEDRHTVRAQCTDDAAAGAEAGFTVTAPGPNPTPNPTPDGTTTPVPTPEPDPDPDDTVPVGLVVGSSLLGAGLLAAAGLALLGRRPRGPRWVRGHVSARLRPLPAATAVTDTREDRGSGTRTVRLEPHADPGERTVTEEDRP
ncbi:hypothetical protein AB0953_12330 [Streptomyces sp. NPDC046866]|uniref:COG1470 family protein n=1 Tax=Streptomyces sp. NPDC046866 TaxID=3154921 RepID=UPI0034549526